MDDLAAREKQAAETILENESLTEGLDDAAAQVLLDWGLACAKVIAQSTAGLDEAEAEEIMSTRLRAVRRLMRPMDDWIKRQEIDSESRAALLNKIIEQATVVYGESYEPPGQEQRTAFLDQYRISNQSPEQTIIDLRQFLENPVPANTLGEENDQKINHQEAG